MSRDEFIEQHMRVCTAGRVKKYDPKKPADAYHSLAYSRRKCAKNLWRKINRYTDGRPRARRRAMGGGEAISAAYGH